MKCVFPVSDGSQEYIEMAKTFVLSARMNSDIELICIYDGSDFQFLQWLDLHGTYCLRWEVPYKQKIIEHYTGERPFSFCFGTYLCVEVPVVLKYYGFDDKFVLFMDADMLVLGDIGACSCYQPSYFAAPPDWDIHNRSFVSTGVMVMNTRTLLRNYDRFINHIFQHNFDFAFAGHGPCSQGAWNTFYRGLWQELPADYDWKPWWGINGDARSVHFSGPKPDMIRRVLNGEVPSDDQCTEAEKISKFVINQDIRAYTYYLQQWEYYNSLVYSSS